jgi:hypothetical protein
MILTRTEYGTDGNVYELSISNGEEYKTKKMIPIEVLKEIRQEIETMLPRIIQDDYWDGYDSCRADAISKIDSRIKEIEDEE